MCIIWASSDKAEDTLTCGKSSAILTLMYIEQDSSAFTL